MNPKHSIGLKQACYRQFTGVDGLEAQRGNEFKHDLLARGIVARDKHHWLSCGKRWIGHDLKADLIHCFVDFRARRKFRYLLSARTVEADRKGKIGADRVRDVDQNLAGEITGRGDGGSVGRIWRRQYHHFGILSGIVHAGEPRIALEFADQGFGVRITNIADAKAHGMTEFRPTSAERAAHRTRADYCNFHVHLLRLSPGELYQRLASSS